MPPPPPQTSVRPLAINLNAIANFVAKFNALILIQDHNIQHKKHQVTCVCIPCWLKVKEAVSTTIATSALAFMQFSKCVTRTR